MSDRPEYQNPQQHALTDIQVGRDLIIRGGIKQEITQNFYYEKAKPGPFQAPPLPQFFVGRPEHLAPVKALMLPENQTVGTLVVSAIHGLGGIGKTVLASALAYDPDVQSRYCDGILWATLGQSPDLLPLLSGWIQALGDDKTKPINLEAATNHLRTLLYDKRVLLVVDDVWNPDHAEPFRVGGEGCCVLITTRRADIAYEAGAQFYSMGLMSPEQAIELFTKRLNRSLTPEEEQAALVLANELGFLPLALQLAAARINNGISWAALTQAMQQEVARLESLEAPRHRNRGETRRLEACLNLSLNAIKEEAVEIWESFVWLGVVPEDAIFAAPMAMTLWGVDIAEASDRLEWLFDDALLLSGTGVLVNDKPCRGYRLHDLLRDIACRRLIEWQDLQNGSMAEAHAALLEKYKVKTQNGQWHTLPDDGYIYAYLTRHLEQAGQPEAIHALLQETREDGRNSWYEACIDIGQPAQFANALAHAWQLAKKMYELQPTESIALQCRYGLIKTTLNSLARNIPIQLFSVFIENGFWTVERGLFYTHQLLEPEDRLAYIEVLIPYLPESLLGKILTDIRNISGDEWSKVETLITLCDRIPDLCPVILEEYKLYIQNSNTRPSLLEKLSDKIPDSSHHVALEITRGISSEAGRTDALVVLSKYISNSFYPEILTISKQFKNKLFQVKVLITLIEFMPNLLPEALALTREIQSVYDRTNCLIALAKYRLDLYSEALTTAAQDEELFAETLVKVAEIIPDLYPEALTATRQIHSADTRVRNLITLAKLMPNLYFECLANIRRVASELERMEALSSLFENLPENLPERIYCEVLEIVEDLNYNDCRAYGLGILAERWPQLYPEFLDSIREIRLEDDSSHLSNRSFIVSKIAQKLPFNLYPEILNIIQKIQSEGSFSEALIAFSHHIPELRLEALRIIQKVKDFDGCAKALVNLARYMPELYPEALNAIRKISYDSDREEPLIALIEHLPEEFYPELLALIQELKDGYSKSRIQIALAKYIPEIHAETLSAIQALTLNVGLLVDFSEYMPSLHPYLLERISQEDRSHYHNVEAIIKLAKYMPELLPEVLSEIQNFESNFDYARAMVKLAEHHREQEFYSEALNAIHLLPHDHFLRSSHLEFFLGYCPDSYIPSLLEESYTIPQGRYRADVFSALLPRLALSEINIVFLEKLLDSLTYRLRKDFIADLSKLSPAIVALGGQEALHGVVAAMRQVCGWWP